VISMGPPQAVDVLRNALAVGADKVYLVSDRAFAGADTLATAYTVATTIKKVVGDVDLVICGKQPSTGIRSSRPALPPAWNPAAHLCFKGQRD